MKLDPFYPILDSVDWIKRLVPIGIRLVQLRIKNVASTATLRDHIAEAKAICAYYQCQLIVNDYWHLAIEEGCDFIHLGQEDLATADIANIRKAGLRFGISTHDEAELHIALATKPNYIAFGPIYPTTLKAMKWAPQGLERISLWRKKIEMLPLVVIGGLNIERLANVFAHHCNSVAVVTDILMNKNPEARIRAWIEATNKWRKLL
ncbi:MAG: thiamine-phosphate pyrophosphorylase [Candidatus Tokpelaia sp. JSC188]|nr:MAG: thiamine-phosphate pyrophosphorylase [Candidatus Tokpelaia sp. JSC188]